VSAEPTAQDYGAMPWSQVVEKGVNNLIPSAWSAVKSVPERAKAEERARTRSMLGVPDSIIANALAAAQRSIG
jgi:hypothetical protein